jgi:hypothetical protein
MVFWVNSRWSPVIGLGLIVVLFLTLFLGFRYFQIWMFIISGIVCIGFIYYFYNSSRKVQIEGKILKYYAKEWDLTLVDRIIIYSNNRWQILFSVFGFPGWSNCVIFVKKGQGFKDRFQVYLNYSELKKFKDYLIKEFPGIEWVEVNSIDMFMKVLKEI